MFTWNGKPASRTRSAVAHFPLSSWSRTKPICSHRLRTTRAVHCGRELDHRRHDLDHAAVEVDRAAGRELRRFRGAPQHRPGNEPRRRAPDVLGHDFLVVDEDLELGLQSDDGEIQLIAIRETEGIDGHNPDAR